MTPSGFEFQPCHFAETALVPRGVAEPCGQKCLHELPGHAWPHSTPTDTDDVHVIILDALFGGKVIVDQGGTNTWHLVGADRSTHPTPADGYAAFDRTRRHGIGKGDDEVRIVIIRGELVRPK